MKKFACLLFFMAILSSCSVHKTYVNDYNQQIRLVKTNFPEVYNLYCRGDVIITDVYTYEKDGEDRVGINYHYR